MNKRNRKKTQVLRELENNPLIERACKKVGIARSTYYRWCGADQSFKSLSEQAQQNGRAKMNDFAESKLLENVNNNHFQSIAFWLRHNTARYHPPDNEHTSAQLEHLKKIAWRRADIINALVDRITEERFLRLLNADDIKGLLDEIDREYETDQIKKGYRKPGNGNKIRWNGAVPYPDEPRFNDTEF